MRQLQIGPFAAKIAFQAAMQPTQATEDYIAQDELQRPLRDILRSHREEMQAIESCQDVIAEDVFERLEDFEAANQHTLELSEGSIDFLQRAHRKLNYPGFFASVRRELDEALTAATIIHKKPRRVQTEPEAIQAN